MGDRLELVHPDEPEGRVVVVLPIPLTLCAPLLGALADLGYETAPAGREETA